MSFSYNDFVQFVKTDGMAHQNRFYVTLGMPRVVGADSARTTQNRIRDLHLLCKGVNLSGVAVSTAPTRLVGEVYEMPYDRTFSGATLTFYVDRQMFVRKFFEDWVNGIQDPESKVMSYYDDIVSEIKISVMDKQNNTTYVHTLHGAFPKKVGDINLDSINNDVMVLDIQFEFHNYVSEMMSPVPNPTQGTTVLGGALGSAGLPPGASALLPSNSAVAGNNVFSSSSALSNALRSAGTLSGPLQTLGGVVNPSSNNISNVINPIKSLYGDFDTALRDFNNGFQSFQGALNSVLPDGEYLNTGISGVLSGDINNVAGRVKEFARGSVNMVARDALRIATGNRIRIGSL